MRKLKLVISDLHVHTGARLPDGRRNVFEGFLEDALLVEFLEHFSTGEYADDDVEVIANGDFFNLLEIELGTGEPTEAITEEVAVQHLRAVMKGHAQLMDALRDFCERPGKKLTFIIGNHDAALLFGAVRAELHKRISPRLECRVDYSFDGVYLTHGHQYEFIHHFDMKSFTRRGPDGTVRLKLPYGALFVIQFLGAMKHRRSYIDKVIPFSQYLRWAFVNDHVFWWEMLIGIVRFWARNRFSHDAYRRREFSLAPRRFANAVNHKPLVANARAILRRTNYRIVILGHSHKLEYMMCGKDGEYFNSGSWLEQISLDVATLGRSRVRPYVRIDYIDGEPRASHHNWVGRHVLSHPLIP
ncbi:MAG: metallophosphoesterase [Candidatus Lernaella stagnicola]|nr:metallophosphoesterase [Candidatus Lernaella stagnicola]